MPETSARGRPLPPDLTEEQANAVARWLYHHMLVVQTGLAAMSQTPKAQRHPWEEATRDYYRHAKAVIGWLGDCLRRQCPGLPDQDEEGEL